MTALSTLRERYASKQEPLRSERRLELGVIFLVLLIVLQLLWLGASSLRDSRVRPVAPARDSLQVVDAAGVGAISATQSFALQSRPVFWQSRRPVEVPDVAAVVQSESQGAAARRLEKLQLTGVIGAGQQGAAIITYKGDRMRLRVGDELEGWTLLSLSPGAAVFASGAARDERRLLPQPVVETAAAREAAAPQEPSGRPPAQAAGSVSAGNKQAGPPRRKPGNTQKPAASLTLGGRQ